MSARPPLDPNATAELTVELDATLTDTADVRTLIARATDRLPAPASLGAGVWVAARVTPRAAERGFLDRLLGRRRPEPGPDVAIACTALLAAGYESVCADASPTAYGRVPRPRAR